MNGTVTQTSHTGVVTSQFAQTRSEQGLSLLGGQTVPVRGEEGIQLFYGTSRARRDGATFGPELFLGTAARSHGPSSPRQRAPRGEFSPCGAR